jgi:hypothetical protein
MLEQGVFNDDCLNQNSKVGKTYKRKCKVDKLCVPEDVFDCIEKCKLCKKRGKK